MTALHAAVNADRLDITDTLLRAGAKAAAVGSLRRDASLSGVPQRQRRHDPAVARRRCRPECRRSGGETALMTAARTGAPAALRVLLERGASIDAREPEFGQTALMIAVRENQPRGHRHPARSRRGGQRADAQGTHAGIRATLQGHRLRLGRRRHQSRRSPRSRTAGRGEGRHDAAAVRRARRPICLRRAGWSMPVPTSRSRTPTASGRC